MATPAPAPAAFPGYHVLGSIGHGGMGHVYLAEDELLGRKVAIKTILPEVAGEGARRARFLREARAMATVEHPRVVRVYSFGETAGQAYFVMELIEGETLAERLRRTPRLKLAEALRIAREVTEALAAAWARGIIHRDIKPSNIILDREGHVHVADFGLARPAEPAADAAITRDGAFVGSPHYVSPEQALAKETDFRADIYSLGIVLYEMLSGWRPFEGANAMDVIARHLNEPVPPLREAAPGTPEPVERLVRSMTEKQPAQRPPSYASLIECLAGPFPEPGAETASWETLSSASPTGALPLPAPVPRAARRRPLLKLGAAAAVALALVAGVVLRDRLVPAPRPSGDLVIATAPFHAVDAGSASEAELLTTLVESELRRLVGDEDGRAVALTSAPRAARSTREARGLGEKASADAVLWGEVLAFRGDVEVRSVLTQVVEGSGPTSAELETLLLSAQGGAPIELRRNAAGRLATGVLVLAARDTLQRGRAETALALLARCPPTTATLQLRAEIQDRLGRAEDADATRRELEAARE
jgi:hypothetical protein